MDYAEVIEFLGSATREDVDGIIAAARARKKSINAVTAASLRPGADVRLDGLSPKYLNGLTGAVASVYHNGKSVSVVLDKDSTDRLRWAPRRGRRFNVPLDMEKYTLAGVPSACAVPRA